MKKTVKPQIARWLSDSSYTPLTPSQKRSITYDRGDLLRERLISATPSRIAVGRTGTRYRTETYLKMRADHAIAKDAVYSEVSIDFVKKFNLLPLKSLCTDREEYLLFPNHGRRLEESSLALLHSHAIMNPDVQIIVGDGLSAWATEENLNELLPCLEQDLRAAGFSLGARLFVKFARVGVQDHIGVAVKAKATLILVGERPGLGSGDSLSIYIAYGPKLDQDNAEKNCISNIRKLGLLPAEASREALRILKHAFLHGRGGVANV
ncbi:MAG: ethanolamine ammonia-lyase subunit EutC [Oligoflexia bacterium]|nr:ethanolamine ammonia-lyase subunit EutC [Oligoflexia bacterium]MBF0365217.1 ethanolamine ammonia-lyase subunit EutC [Oligoflexia bacterium]